jgi:hypothetical protein
VTSFVLSWPWHVRAVVGITLVAALLRFATLDRQSLWSDEAMTWALVHKDFVDMLRTIPHTESTPPLYYVLVWLWAKVFGYGEVGLRSLSAVAGTATVPVTYYAGNVLLGRRVGVAAAAVVSVSPILVWYSQEARAYALVVLLCAVSFAALTRALATPAPRSLAVWAAASVLAMATHYFAFFVVAVEVVWLLLAQRSVAVRWAIATVAAGTAAIAVFAQEQRSNELAQFIGVSEPLGERVRVLGKQLLVGAELPADRATAAVVALFFAVSVVLVLTRAGREIRRGALVAASVGAAPVVAPIVLAVLDFDYVNTRNTLAGLAPLAIAGAAGLAVAVRPRAAVPAIGALCAILLAITVDVSLDANYQRPNWRGFARDVERGVTPRLLVVTPDHETWFARVPLQIYLPRARAIDQGLVPVVPQVQGVNRRPVDHATPRRVTVREVVVAAVGWYDPTRPRGLPRSFRLVERRVHGYRFLRFQSARPVALSPAAFVQPKTVVLLERATP